MIKIYLEIEKCDEQNKWTKWTVVQIKKSRAVNELINEWMNEYLK